MPWDLLIRHANACDVELSEKQVAGFQHYYRLLVEGNKTCNLTRITQEREVIVKHFLDSLWTLRGLPPDWRTRPVRLLDIGSGAGFPGVPLLLACPAWQGVLLEATRKKALFLASALTELGLADRGESRWGRAEDGPKNERAGFDLVTARAVANVQTLVRWGAPYVRPGGRAVFLKGPRAREELAEVEESIVQAGCMSPRMLELDLPEGAGDRLLIIIERQQDAK